MKNRILKQMKNYRGGLAGVIIVLLITIIVYFIGFMTALGNDTPTARKILNFVNLLIQIAYPVWICPIAYIIGAFCIGLNSKKR
ncbi:MAG: hypothetical protein O2U61_04645 [Candidatus Bathyarchaeota archaeon]|nr:hypothetical protein [Candidatus Bathyarchaeota archaeon]